ncbi:hypothetical protein ASE00_03430 [Sphingomonas sp. Root710]|uniref:hypothetical protein n=1 Tax=Sphingomonas sp. Root710 TaxID=1736594 RepID=UPI0006FAB433|nr:hypothetical protein ASE00_03430 [Sphingomonas sp. Root710]
MSAALSSLLLQAVALASTGGASDEPAAAPVQTASEAPAQPAPLGDPSLLAVPANAPASTVDDPMIDGRRRPGYVTELPAPVSQHNAGAVSAPPPEAFPTDQFPIPDRWRLVKALCPDKNFTGLQAVCHSKLDPYHQNPLKADVPIQIDKKPFFLPITGDDWFFGLNAISDSVLEPRSFPTPVADQTSTKPGAIGQFGRDRSLVAAQTFILGAGLSKGSTAYKPPDVEYRIAVAYQVNYVNVQERRVLHVESSRPTHRTDKFLGLQELFVDKHLGNRSDRFDFDSLRIGIQPFQFDFRGFLFQDNQLGVRFFGNRDNNRYQFNVQGIWRLEKDTNSGLNDITRKPRDDYILAANLFMQDFPLAGLTSLVSATANINREKDRTLDHNGFPVRPALLGDQRPREYDVFYVGYSLDGRVKRFNTSTTFYAAFGQDRNSFFTSKKARIQAFFAASELSYDLDWIRVKLSGLYATGDGKPKDNKETGFSAIFENPIFAGADTSYWIRQAVPFAGGGVNVAIAPRNGILNDLRTSKEEGQSNFNNPGTMLLGVGADFDILPQLRFSTNLNHLWFENTATLRELRNEGSIPKSIGWDLSGALIWRPSMVQNAVFRLSGAVFDPGKGFSDLFTNSRGDDRYYSVLFNAILSF